MSRFLAFFLALYIFNFSIDTRDTNPDHVAEDLTFNDIESVLEFSLECLLGIENAVEEHDERDQDDGGSFEFNKILYSLPIRSIQITPPNFIRLTYSGQHLANALLECSLDVNSPPPWA